MTAPRDAARFLLATVLVALAAAAFAIAFRAALAFTLARVLGAHDVVTALTALPVWARVALPAGGGLVAGGLALLATKAPGTGDVMEALAVAPVRLSLRNTLARSAASFAALATGGSIGREGPLIALGGSAGQTVGDAFRLPADRIRLLIAAGTAAGFAAAYNTPLAAVLFVLEVMTGVVAVDAVAPTLVAVVIATAATRAVVGEGPILGARAFALHTPLELLAFVPLGVCGALAAQAFMRLLRAGERLFARAPGLPWRPALGGLAAGGVVAMLPSVAGNGYEPLNGILDGRFTLGFVAVLVAAKCIATTASVSSGSPGGVFTPTLLVGSGVGLLFGAGLGQFTEVGTGYALVGMAATLAGTTHAPLMASVMAFELSGDYAVVLPLVLATSVSAALSKRMAPQSIYSRA